MGLVLSIFSGLGALDEGFREAGWCIVSAGDVAWSSLYEIQRFHPPAGVFEGVIGGDPCQSHSVLANLVRAKGLEPSFPDMTPEFQRVIEEAQPRWFLRENVPRAPDLHPDGYAVRNFVLDNWASLGEEQSRRRRFWIGMRNDLLARQYLPDREVPELRRWIDFALVPPLDPALTCNTAHDHLDGAEKIRQRRFQVTSHAEHVPVKLIQDGHGGHKLKKSAATARHHGAIGTTGGHAGNPPRYSLDEMLSLQGLPKDLFQHSPLTVQGKRKLCGNAVPLPMARAIAKAVKEATK